MTDRVSELTSVAIQAHTTGGYQEALEMRLQAAALAGPDDPRYGGIMTIVGATHDRLGYLGEAMEAAQTGYAVLEEQLDSPDEDRQAVAVGEFPIAALYVGTFMLKLGIREQLEKPDAATSPLMPQGRSFVEEAWQRIQDIRRASGKPFHQHEINFSRHLAIARSLDGEPKNGAFAALGAAGLALFSESPKLVADTSDLNRSERFHAKTKALKGAAAAGMVAILSASKRTRIHALRLAAKSL